MQSLLGQFYSRIKGSQEDIASEGLTYILQRSKSARLAINRIFKSDCGLDFGDLNFRTQKIGGNLERPDISGYDNDGKEVLILEAKFWASLTDNQPLEYLNRIQKNSALIFICPTLRVRPIFDELLKRLKATEISFNQDNDSHSISFENDKYMMVKTWNEILGTIKVQLVQDNEQTLISDIDQIIGFCDTIDSNAFLPIQSDDLSPKYAKRNNSYYDLIDKVVDELKKRKFVDTNRLKATPQKYGYTRYLKTERLGISLNLKFDFWASHADTPFWISFRDNTTLETWSTTDELKKACKNVSSQFGFNTYKTNSGEIFIALFPIIDKTEDIVINDLTDQIITLLNELDRQMNYG